jgi:hypothetical protein
MHPTIRQIESLLAASREVLADQELDIDRLQLWGAERNAIVARLKERDQALAGADGSAVEPLLHELLHLDREICARVIEKQRELGLQISAARTVRQALVRGTSPASHRLQRLA